MTNKDLFRLAKISLAARKKSTRSTVRGIAFGLILLIPVLYIAFGIFGDLNSKVNANPEILYMNLQTAAVRSDKADETLGEYPSTESLIFSSQHADNLINGAKTEEVYAYEQIIAPFNPYLVDKNNGAGGSYDSSRKAFALTYGDGTQKDVYVYPHGQGSSYNQDGAYNRNNVQVPFAAIVGDDGRFAPKKIIAKFGDIFARGGGFTGDGKGQVIVSETFLKSLSLTADDVYDKNFSIKYTDSYNSFCSNRNSNSVFIDGDADPDNNVFVDRYGGSEFPYDGEREIYFCQDFKVVGVIKDEVTSYAMESYGAGDSYGVIDHIMTNMMFFTSASAHSDDGETLEPVIKLVEEDESDDENDSFRQSYFVATYTQSQNEFEYLNKEYMAFGANSFNSLKFVQGYSDGRTVNADPYATRNVLVDVLKFNELDAAVKSVKADFSTLLGDKANYMASLIAGTVYEQLSMVYSVFTYVVLAMSVIGGIIFFASMVNLFNSIVHSVDSRKSYLGVLRAVGAKRSLINKMYLAESLTIFKRALIWILIFATAICVGIKFLLDFAFKYMNELPIMPFKMAVSFVYIPVALAVALGVLLILGFAFSYGCSWKVSRDPITKTLAA